MYPEANDGDLLRRMLEGDEDAFTILYRRHKDRVYRFAHQMTGSSGLSEEVTQEVFLTLMREGRSFQPHRASLRAWLYGIARNYIRRCRERERPYVPLEDGAGEENAADLAGSLCAPEDVIAEFTSRETVEQVRRAVLALPGNYREAVILCELHELNYEEAAQILGCALGTVRSRLHRAKELLAERLKAWRETSARCGSDLRQCHR